MSGNRWIVSSLAGLAGLGLVFALSGCVGEPAQAPSTTGSLSTGSPSVSQTPQPTSAPSASSASGSSPPAQPSSGTNAASATSPLTIFYVAVDDQGKSGPLVGCGDSIVATETGPVIYASQVEAAMSTLLEDKDAEHGQSGLVNTLSASELTYVSASVSGDTVTVELSGEILSGGTCDDPRIIAQLTHTAMVAAGTGEAVILINGVDVNKYLSQK
ncbi:GerMN domain-containing protein [Paeniglutamicibacter gangotriensis]|uniref:Spore germination protein n=1 Tax=Paeniglutamicibacter gangotriensis Lz1y TaxID=1276920 RepID=M7NPZ1_9MICC|nr:GerMN domain-containing protein [Paeniglutamicibacter gangotriensis]EMR00609.1 Spore germination protein [Paeniglutamicibacter gangotriensis Lz1y]